MGFKIGYWYKLREPLYWAKWRECIRIDTNGECGYLRGEGGYWTYKKDKFLESKFNPDDRKKKLRRILDGI